MNTFFTTDTTPKIIFKDEKLVKEISAWLRIKKKVNDHFGRILTEIGFSPDDTIILDNYDADLFSFHYSSIKQGNSKNNTITLNQGHFSKHSRRFTITNDIEIKTYALKQNNKIELIAYSIKDSSTGNIYSRSLYLSWGDFKVENNNYQFKIYIEIPKYLVEKALREKGYKFRLKDEKNLEQMLREVTFPVAIGEFFKTFCFLFLESGIEYPYLTITQTKKDSNGKYATTDLIELENGQITQFITTKSKKTITLENLNEWLYNKQKNIDTNEEIDNQPINESIVTSVHSETKI
ncbi:MAG: hypothetical protein ACOXZS_03610 [Bacilli bacterium]